MKPQYFTFGLALATSAQAALAPRDAQEIIDDINKIGTDTEALEDNINKFTGNVNDAIPITTAQVTLLASVKKGTSDVEAAPPLSDADATSIFTAISALIPKVIDSVNAFVAKQPLFDSASLGTIAASDLSALQKESGDFAGALVSRAPAASQAAASSLSSCIDAAFASAVASSTATSCGGAAAPATTGASGASSTGAPPAASPTSGGDAPSPTSAASGGSVTPASTGSGAPPAASTGAASSSHGSVGGLLGAIFAAACAIAL